MKIVLLKEIEYGWTHIQIVSENLPDDYAPSGYCRISEVVDIEFPLLPHKDVVGIQLAALDKAESELRAKLQDGLNGINQRRRELQALTHEPETT